MSPRPERPVSTIMSWPVATIDHDATLEEAAEALAADSIGALVVLRDGDLAGIISERDVVVHLAAGADQNESVSGSPNGSRMVAHKYRLPVVLYTSAMSGCSPYKPIVSQPSFVNVFACSVVFLITAVRAARTWAGFSEEGNFCFHAIIARW